MRAKLILYTCLAAVTLLAAIPMASVVNAASSTTTLVQELRSKLGAYKNVEAAGKAGYKLFHGCVNGPDGGAMGVHFVKDALVGDGKIDADNPEALIYEYRNGKFNLVAVEYVVIADDWNKANDNMPPVLKGQLFTYNVTPNRYGIPAAFYALHVWAWKDNPNGMFADWNPRVSCEQFSGQNPAETSSNLNPSPASHAEHLNQVSAEFSFNHGK